MQDAVMENNNKVWLLTPAQEVLAQGTAALLGNDWSFGLCWSMWRSAFSVVLVEEAECISNVKETLFKWFAFYHENKEKITPQLTRIFISKLCIRETLIEWEKARKSGSTGVHRQQNGVLVDLNLGTPLFVLSHFTLCLVKE